MSAARALVNSLRGRVALAAGASVVVVLVLLGVALVRSTQRDDVRALDERLERRAALLASPGTLARAASPRRGSQPLLGMVGDELLAANDTGVRVLSGDRELLALGDLPPGRPPPPPASAGLRTVHAADGSRWRMAVRRIPASDGSVELFAALAPLEQRARALRRRVALLGALGVAAAAGLAALAAGLLLRPLRRLRSTAELVADTGQPRPGRRNARAARRRRRAQPHARAAAGRGRRARARARGDPALRGGRRPRAPHAAGHDGRQPRDARP